MRQFILWNIVLAIVVGFLGPWSSKGTAVQSAPAASAQESFPAARPGEKADFVSERLQAFARTYVAIRRLIDESEPSKGAPREAVSKLEQTLDANGFTPDSFQKTFALVNADDDLRNKALELIASEREKLPS